ncbi:unnamed protein product [Brassicogethes aeneus]|uniref:Hexosyltransferase n=1 Tax=Brassicogethes aeneus TaxID=1431903 RepID=A0A9P0FHP5_BRAAE|nr:unnamed protein product [Brassicogethes aeneus]
MKICIKRKIKPFLFFVFINVILLVFGVFTHFFEEDFKKFHYPYEGNIEEFIYKLKQNETPEVLPINYYNFKFNIKPKNKCENIKNLRLVFIIKSSPENVHNREAIRISWGFERRFSDVEIRRVFLLGLQGSNIVQNNINKEAKDYNDIVQGNFTDSYYNNTLKTMLGFTWAIHSCSNSRFYMFVDDDYYVSTKNVLRFIKYPTQYPTYLKNPTKNFNKALHQRRINQLDLDLNENVRLYTGYAFESSPLRHYTSKWYVSLEEYPYNKWPPYVTAGAYVLSREALMDMYYASFYTKHFRFDDIYVALLAFKAKIEPFHCEEFCFHKKTYYRKNYEFVVASHGYSDSKEMVTVWTDQKSLGFA